MTVHNIGGRNGDKPSASIIYVSPAMARRVLEKNTRNRPIAELHVQRLMSEMSNGRWQYNGEAIKWSVDDVLLDGQHRLTALSRMPDDFEPIPFLVVRGLSTKTQDTMDQGRKRSAGDQLVLDGLTKDGKIIAGAVRAYIDWMGGHLFMDRVSTRVSNTQVIEWAEGHPVEVGMMEEILKSPIRRIKARPSVTLAALLHFFLIDGESGRDFMRGLLTGAGLDAGNPILTLREKLDSLNSQGLKVTDRDYIGFFVLAWNAWRSDRKVTRLQRPVGGSWTRETFPKAV